MSYPINFFITSLIFTFQNMVPMLDILALALLAKHQALSAILYLTNMLEWGGVKLVQEDPRITSYQLPQTKTLLCWSMSMDRKWAYR